MMRTTPDGCTISLNAEQSELVLHAIKQMHLSNCGTKRTRQVAHDIDTLIKHCMANSSKLTLKLSLDTANHGK